MSIDKPAISVLVTAYNAADWLKQCLDSLVGQDFDDFECLVGDDASTDHTYDVFRATVGGDARFKYARRTQNRGGGENIADLMAHARGDVCVELGADDYFMTSEALGRIRREYLNFPTCDATSGSMVITPDGGICAQKPDVLWWRRWSFNKPISWRTPLGLRALSEQAADIVDPATGAIPRYGWDVAIFWPIVARARQYRTIHDILYAYRLHETNDQHDHRSEQLATEYRMRTAMDAIMMDRPMPWWPKSMRDEFAAKQAQKAAHE